MRKIRVEDIKVEDLIGRNFEKPSLDKLREDMSNQTVLVTGAGGSIGSELCRQIVTMGIKRIVLAEHSELALYGILEELRETCANNQDMEIIPFLINICDKKALEYLFENYSPTFIYHAAAYKHVNIVEVNPFIGMINNILSTKNLLEVSAQNKVKKFVLISTDKAVRSTSIMGATKRICELLTTHTALENNLSFSSVRFGNVAGSSGSLIPKLKSQVSNGKPLTITDKRMKRFFMLIPEAVNLVLKSSEDAKPADISLLNMGTSIEIMDIANKLLDLSGRDPETYPMIFTGAKPGEKLEEELIIKNGVSFKEGQMFLRLSDGDEGLSELCFKEHVYENIFEAVTDIIKFAEAYNPDAIELLRACSNNSDVDENVNIIKVDFTKKRQAA